MLPVAEPCPLHDLLDDLPLVEIVSHCYAAELPQYAAMLVYQASSLVLHKPEKCEVCLSVCVWHDREIDDTQEDWMEDFFLNDVPKQYDPNARKAVDWMKKLLVENDVSYAICHMTKGEIGRRCIGRNRITVISDADLVWFADVDQVFRDGVLDRLVETPWPDGASMIYPREIMIHRDWKTGDERTSAVDLDDPRLVDIDPSEFVPKRYGKAIGGVQIVRGDFAREHGYLDGDERWQRPSNRPFGDFRDDMAYRRFCERHGPIVGVDLPGMYRIRHAKTTYQEDRR